MSYYLISAGVWGNIYVYSSFPGLHPDLFGFALQVNERDSLWENPRAAATSWKPCAERRSDEISGKYKNLGVPDTK
jgi:hypothetical protein